MKLHVPEYIADIHPYKPGKPLEALEREYGIRNSVKLASNENPLGPSPAAMEAVRKAAGSLHRYPDGGGYELVSKLAERFSLPRGRIVLGGGSDDVIGMLTRALLRPGDRVLIPSPSFLMYEIAARSAGASPVRIPLRDFGVDPDGILERVDSRTRMLFVCNPNNPTGSVLSDARFREMLKALPPEILVVADEAYIEFVRQADCSSRLHDVGEDTPLVVLRTFSKAYGLAGLRIGYGVMPEAVADLLHRVRQPFNASVPAQAGAAAALEDQAFLHRTIALVHTGLDRLYAEMDRLGLRYVTSQANFFLIDVEADADDVFERMLRKGVIVRSMAAYGYDTFIRVNVGLPEENERFVQALEAVLSGGGAAERPAAADVSASSEPAGAGTFPPLLITIDGPAGAGKTTVSRMLAERLRFRYVDTGSLYRGIALAALEAGLQADDDDGLNSLLDHLQLDYRWEQSSGACLLVNGSDVSDRIRTPDVTMFASAASARPVVRRFLLDLQRRLGEDKCAVFEGRDMGTVVFPDADVKFFLDASLPERAKRRFLEMGESGGQPLEEVESEMARRDANDSSRALAPLKPAPDAVLLDSTDMSAEAVVERMLSAIRSRLETVQ